MSKVSENNVNISDLYEILKNCAQLQSYESLQTPPEEYYDVLSICDDHAYSMMSTKSYLTNGTISGSSCKSDELFIDNIIEENGRISLAYENLRTIPRRIADKFAAQTKFLDLSYNNFQNLCFLTFFDDLHTLILDRNDKLDPNSLPYLPNLEILWINNCGIIKVTDWIQRIKEQCPSLNHLSIMGNPGIKNAFYIYPSNLDYLPHRSIPIPTTIVTNYRDYIFNMLPGLMYLDGVPRNQESSLQNERVSSLNGKSQCTISSTNSAFNGSSASDQKERNGRQSQHTSPTLSFKDLFTLKRRKKLYQSSSTN